MNTKCGAEPTSILALNDDCLEIIFKEFTAGIQREIVYFDEIDYTDVLFQLKIASSCVRFCDIFTNLIWKSKEKHLTLRPQQLFRTLGPMNTTFYMKAMQSKIIKLELEENYIPWFLLQTSNAEIVSFPLIKVCVLKNSFLKPVKEQDVQQITTTLLPNLSSLTLTTAVSEDYFEKLKFLNELHFNNRNAMSFSYFKTICTALENLSLLNITAPLCEEVLGDEGGVPLEISILPRNLEILVLNVTAAKPVLREIFKLKKLQKLILTILNNQALSENVESVNRVLLEKSNNIEGFGLNKMFDSALRVWSFPKFIPQLKRVRKLVFSVYEYIPSLVDFKRLIFMGNIKAICLKNCFIIQNDTVLKLVKSTKVLMDLDISGCYLIDAETLLPNLLKLRKKLYSKKFTTIRPLSIYTDENLNVKLPEFWKEQQYIVKGDKCPIDVEETGFIFDFN